MRTKYLLATLLAAVWAISFAPDVAATTYKMSAPSLVWQTTGTVDAGTMPPKSSAETMAISEGKIYTLDYNSKLMWYTSGGSWSKFALNVTNTQPALASDGKGNLVYHYNNGIGTTTAKNLRVLKAGSTSETDYIDIATANKALSARSDFCSASGNLYSGTGMVYFYPTGNQMQAIKISATDKTAKVITYTDGDVAPNTTAYAKIVRGKTTEILLEGGMQSGYVNCYTIPTSGTTRAMTDKVSAPTAQDKALLSTAKVYKDDDRTFYVYPKYGSLSGWNFTSASFVVQNVSTGETVEQQVWSSSTAYAAGTGGYAGLWLDAEFDSSDATKLYVYCYLRGECAKKYVVNVTAAQLAAPTLSGSTVVNQTGNPGRQDAVLTWTAVSGAKSYKVYDTTDEKKTYTTTGTTQTALNILRDHTYYVVAINSDGVEGEKSNEVTCKCDLTIAHIPEWSDATGEIAGSGKVNVAWSYSYGHRPGGYDVYRDGVKIASDFTEYLYIDEHVTPGDHEYQIYSVYYTDNEDPTSARKTMTAASSVKTVTVGERDASLEQYGIVEVYDYAISASNALGNNSNSALTAFNEDRQYRQGVFRDGYWYIAQLWNAASGSYADATTGGIIRIKADDVTLEQMAASATNIYSFNKGSNDGLGIDDAGNFLIHYRTASQWGLSYGMDTGRIIHFNDPTAASPTCSTKDVTLLTSATTDRCDYYSMKGDVYSGTGHIYLAPNESGRYYDFTVTNGSVASSKTGTTVSGTPTNNYIIPLAGREDIIHCARSYGIYNVVPGSDSDPVSVYTSYSRKMLSGGISVWFNNDLILITPQAVKSLSKGDFVVARGYKADATSTNPADAQIDAGHLQPIATIEQPDNGETATTYVNACWFGVTAHDTGDDAKDPYLDIYVYAPGVRFAKYRLFTNKELPKIENISMEVSTVCDVDDDNNPVDITGLAGTVTWDNVNINSGGNYDIHGYMVDLKDSQDNSVEDTPRYVDAEGRLCDESWKPVDNSTCLDGNTFSQTYDDLTTQQYTVTVIPVYIKNGDTELLYEVDEAYEVGSNDYLAPEPSIDKQAAVRVYTDPCKAWTDPNDETKYRTNRRIDIDFDKPDFNGEEENPRSYYQVWYKKPGQTDYQQLTDFKVIMGDCHYLGDDDITAAGPRRAESAETDPTAQSEVPGNYDFRNKGKAVADNAAQDAVITMYYQPEVNADGTFVDASDDPTTWSYILNATYAATNEAITKVSETETIEAQNGGVTGVELPVVETVLNESVYPAVTRTTFNASSVDAISAVTVYAADGSVTMKVDGGGQSRLTVDASALTPGIYFVSINGHKAHKLIKR
jgi:hypothetical protein